MQKIQRAAVLRPGQIKHLLRVVEATSRFPERDAVILLMGFTAGLRITETALITVADIMFPSGKLRSEISIRAAIAKELRQRTVYFTSDKLIAVVERYVAYRIERDLGVSLDPSKHRGLLPDLPPDSERQGLPLRNESEGPRTGLRRGL